MSIRLENVSYVYNSGTSTETYGLKQVSFRVERGEFLAIIGHTGSGKSTLIQQLNGLEKPTKGKVFFEEKDIWTKGYDLRALRCKVGLVFQYPEHQLFEETVLKDVCFGPLNKDLSHEEARQKAINALELVGIPQELHHVSPFELSGGQKRKVAIAGILAMEPEFLILDEPTAGLDPKGRDQLLELLKKLHQEKGIGVVLVSHSMEDVAKYAERIVVMSHGEIAYDGTPVEVFSHSEQLGKLGLDVPVIFKLMHQLKQRGFQVDENIMEVEDAKNSIKNCLRHLD
ncbi:MAG: energy-coupling factor transporter ATPase [Eubacterium sp.]|nr:energy-coupling factor transporter ATPase [Eubacterium sp.]